MMMPRRRLLLLLLLLLLQHHLPPVRRHRPSRGPRRGDGDRSVAVPAPHVHLPHRHHLLNLPLGQLGDLLRRGLLLIAMLLLLRLLLQLLRRRRRRHDPPLLPDPELLPLLALQRAAGVFQRNCGGARRDLVDYVALVLLLLLLRPLVFVFILIIHHRDVKVRTVLQKSLLERRVNSRPLRRRRRLLILLRPVRRSLWLYCHRWDRDDRPNVRRQL